MKKSLLLLLAAMMSLSMSIAAHNAPARVELPDNQKIMGHFDSDAISTEGVALTTTGKITLGVILESEEIDLFYGGRIVAFRVGLAENTTVSKVFVMPISAGGSYGTMVPWTCSVSETGWNVIQLPTPYLLDIPEGGRLMIGFEYEQTSTNKPLALVNEGEVYDTYMRKKVGATYRWMTAGLKSQGNLCVQCIVEKDNYPEVLIKAANLVAPKFVNKAEGLPFSFTVKNRGIQPLDAQALSFDVNVDGKKLSTVSNSEAIEPGEIKTLQGIAEIADLESGNHTLTIDGAMAGEEVLDYVYPMNADFVAHSGSFPRQKHVVEQLTSTYCTYCPLGNSMLGILTSERDDIIWVGLHGNLGSGVDPYTTAQGDTAMVYMTGGSISYPSAAFDRSTGWENDAQIVNSIGYYEEYHQQMAGELGQFFDFIAEQKPTFASINIDPVVDKDTREAVITVSGEMTSDFDYLLGEGNKLTVYITEDSLVARQLNNGSWINGYRHNGVFRCALGSVKGVELNRVEGGYSNEFTVTIPEEWNIANLNVVAFISRPLAAGGGQVFTDLAINNAETARLINQAEGVEELLLSGDVVPVEYYDIMGRKHDSMQPGINIVKMSDGSARKVLVK